MFGTCNAFNSSVTRTKNPLIKTLKVQTLYVHNDF